MSFNPENYFLKRMGNCNFKIHYKNFTFVKPETMFGRGKDCDFILKNMRCSLNHCKITFENGKMFIEDFSSAGTFVNNEKIIRKKIELFDGAIVGMGADPNRSDHVDKTNFYIYKVQKVEAPISLDSSDEDEAEQADQIPISNTKAKIDENENLEMPNFENVNEIIANIPMESLQGFKSIAKDSDNDVILCDSDDTVCLENDENLEDLTRKIDEHLTAHEKNKTVDASSTSNQVDGQVPVASVTTVPIKMENDTSSSNQRILSLCQKFNRLEKSKNTDAGPSMTVPARVPSPVDIQSEWISSAFTSNSGIPNDILGKNLDMNAADSASLQPEKSASTLQSSEVESPPPEPPIFTPGPSSFQLFPMNLDEGTGLRPSGLDLVGEAQTQAETQNSTKKSSNLPQNSSNTPQKLSIQTQSSSSLPQVSSIPSQNPSISSQTPSTPARRFSNLALRKKVLQPASSFTAPTQIPLNSSPISSTSNLSSPTLSTVSSENLPIISKSTSSALPTSDEQLKNATPDEIKSKVNFLRHYGMQTKKLIDIPENPMSLTSDLLDEVENPKEAPAIMWKQGVAMIKTVKKPRKKRGRPKKSEEAKNDSKNQNSPPKPVAVRNFAAKSTKSSRIIPTADSNSSSDYKSAQSGDSEAENYEQKSKRRKLSSDADESSEPKSENQKIWDTMCGSASMKPDQKLEQISSKNHQNLDIKAASKPRILHKFPDSDDSDKDKNKEPKAAPKQVASKPRKIQKRRESIINMNTPNVQKYLSKIPKEQLARYLDMRRRPSLNAARVGSSDNQPQSPKSPSTSKSGPNDKQKFPESPKTSTFNDKFKYQGLVDNSPKSATPTTPKIPMKKRRQSVFQEQAQLIPENLTPNERSNAMRRWNQNTTKLIDIPIEDPNRKRRGRPRLNEDGKIKMLVEKSKAERRGSEN
ncbi:uncharacterized protein DDB_G0284459-like [Chironomus tepperi]|uniref:uncharacterized protein DDB_G0284459-like n=1 Tax=Chironomus tepperi TaxID=113505 RepID=UPI00391F0CA7